MLGAGVLGARLWQTVGSRGLASLNLSFPGILEVSPTSGQPGALPRPRVPAVSLPGQLTLS